MPCQLCTLCQLVQPWLCGWGRLTPHRLWVINVLRLISGTVVSDNLPASLAPKFPPNGLGSGSPLLWLLAACVNSVYCWLPGWCAAIVRVVCGCADVYRGCSNHWATCPGPGSASQVGHQLLRLWLLQSKSGLCICVVPAPLPAQASGAGLWGKYGWDKSHPRSVKGGGKCGQFCVVGSSGGFDWAGGCMRSPDGDGAGNVLDAAAGVKVRSVWVWRLDQRSERMVSGTRWLWGSHKRQHRMQPTTSSCWGW